MVYTKRLLIPDYYKSEKKIHKFIVTGSCGPHKKSKAIPLAVAMRDFLNIAENISEVKTILSKKNVKIDNIVRTDHRFPLGFMDVISINDSLYRVLVDKKGLCIKPIEKSQSNLKLLKIVKKSYNRNKKLQLGFHDGRTLIVDKDVYKTGDVVVFDLTSKKIKDVIQFKRESIVLITDGKNKGKIGKLQDYTIVRGSQPNKVVIRLENDTIETLKDYVFIVGQENPVIKLE
ncbi:MAG: 30S ribosomal protein S4e [Candidatus Aenigmarchaeota archaeon]|nr:30S ribosomal protein S4e [Candidatus Aenigmarchaeota archaeon]